MSFKQLFLFVEGPDDKELFERFVVPALQNRYDRITIKTTAANLPQVNQFIKILQHQNNDYWKINDLDESPCFTQKKEAVQGKHPHIPREKILIVKIEIEGWYAAGLSEESRTTLKVKFNKEPDELTKEDFVRCMPERYVSVKAFMQDILDHYSFDEARRRSSSFHYCMMKLGL